MRLALPQLSTTWRTEALTGGPRTIRLPGPLDAEMLRSDIVRLHRQDTLPRAECRCRGTEYLFHSQSLRQRIDRFLPAPRPGDTSKESPRACRYKDESRLESRNKLMPLIQAFSCRLWRRSIRRLRIIHHSRAYMNRFQ